MRSTARHARGEIRAQLDGPRQTQHGLQGKGGQNPIAKLGHCRPLAVVAAIGGFLHGEKDKLVSIPTFGDRWKHSPALAFATSAFE